VSAHSCRVKCLGMHPGELAKLREIADKQTSDRPVATCSNCDIVKDGAGDRDHEQMTSKAVTVSQDAQPLTHGQAITLDVVHGM